MPRSRHTRVTRAAAVLAFALTAVAGCSAPPEDPSTSTAGEALRSAPGSASACPTSHVFGLIKFVAPSSDATCPTVFGWQGSWVSSTDYPAQACNATDPSRGEPVFCTYDWTPSPWSPNAPPDEGALDALPNVYLAPFEGGYTSCQAPTSLPHAALLDRAGVTCPPRPHHPDGAAPCTVCDAYLGHVHHGYVALPATSNLHTLSVQLSNGTERVVTFDGAEPSTAARNASAAGLKLPQLPPGVH